MASGGNLSRTLEGGHETFYEFACTLCAVDGRHVEATKYCVECSIYICARCIQKHDIFPLNKRHTMVDQTQFATAGLSALVSFPTKRCKKHPSEMINMFCGNHDVVCCSVCKALDHSSCDGTQYITDAAKGIQKTREYKHVMKETKTCIADVDKVLSSRKVDTSRIVNEKHKVKQTIADLRKKVNKYFDDLETKSLNELDMKEKLIVDGIDKDVRDLDSMRTEADDVLKKLKSFKGDNECELFVLVKDGKLMVNDANEKCAEVSHRVNREFIRFKIDPKIEAFVTSLDMLGTFSLLPPTVAERSGQYNIKEESDCETCSIGGICQLQDGTILVTDYNNEKLKRLDQSYTVLDSVQLAGFPDSVCAIGADEVAVSLYYYNEIQVVSVGRTLALTRSITVGNCCRGIVYMGGNLYVCCGDEDDAYSGRIEVYNNAGVLQHYIPRSRSCLSFVPVYITASDDGQHLFVTNDYNDDITMLDLAGDVINTFNAKDLVTAQGMCTDDLGHVFVCGEDSNTVVQLLPEHQTIHVVLRETDGIDCPRAVCYDRKTSRLLLGSVDLNILSVFKDKTSSHEINTPSLNYVNCRKYLEPTFILSIIDFLFSAVSSRIHLMLCW